MRLLILLSLLYLCFGHKIIRQREQRALLDKPEANEIPPPPANQRPVSSSDIFERLFGANRGSSERLHEVLGSLFRGLHTNERQGGGGGSLHSSIFGGSAAWWHGPNVCRREKKYEEPSGSSAAGIISSTMTRCVGGHDSYRCVMKIGQGDSIQVHETIYECCLGFEREPGVTGCTKEVILEPLIDTLRRLNLTDFVDAVTELGLDEKLASGNYTLFVPLADETPEDDIFSVVPASADRQSLLRSVVLSQIVPGRVSSDDMMDEGTVDTLEDGVTLRFNYFDFPAVFATANCARVTKTDERALNGIVHVVDRLIMPAKHTLADMVAQNPKLSIMRELMDEETRKMLADETQHLTLFAFTDEAFNRLNERTQQRLRDRESCTGGLLGHHTLPHTICSAALPRMALLTNLAGRLLNASRDDDDVLRIEGMSVVAADRMAKNGVMYVLDGIVIPDEMLDTDELLERRAPSFAGLLKDTGAMAALQGYEKATVFVPPSLALEELMTEETTETAENLRGHMVDSLTTLDDRRTVIRTAAGNDLTLRVDRQPFVRARLQCANVLHQHPACNGVVYAIDRALTVPRLSAMKMLQSNANYSQFTMMVEAAGLETNLDSGDTDVGTVLVPTNKAFADAEMTNDDIDAILSSPENLQAFVRGHLLKVALCCSDMAGHFWLGRGHETLAGHRVTTSSFGPVIRVGRQGSFVRQCDQVATNGLLQELSKPLQLYNQNQFTSDNWMEGFSF